MEAPELTQGGRPLPDQRRRTSAVVADVMQAGEGERIALRALVGFLEGRSFGIAALVFTLPAYLPLPPGLPVVSGAALILLAVQMIGGRRSLWLPQWLLRKSMDRAVFARYVGRILPAFRAIERITRPRWSALTSPAGKRILGIVIVVLAVMLILPIPILGNLPLALAASLLAIALAEEDGLLMALGYAAAIGAVAVTSTFAWLGFSLIF